MQSVAEHNSVILLEVNNLQKENTLVSPLVESHNMAA